MISTGARLEKDDGKDQHTCRRSTTTPSAGQPQGQVDQFQHDQAQRGGDQQILQTGRSPSL